MLNGTLELGTVGVPEFVQPNQISPIFGENLFFVFWGAPKDFFKPQNPYLALETSLFFGGGGQTSKTFWSEQQP